MQKVELTILRSFIAILATAIVAVGVFGQLTIINTPSTDTLQAKTFYLEVDAIGKPVSFNNGGFQSYGYRTVYGVNRKTEVGVSFFYTRIGGTSPLEMQFSAKRKLFASEKWGLAAAIGATAYVPLNQSAGNRTLFVTYANFSKVIHHANGLRLTAGAYQIFNTSQSFGARTGAILGLEQPLSKRVNFVADWSSGRNRFGYLATGLNLIITKNQSATVAYNFGNTGHGNNFFTGFYAVTF